jgi:hypothetical protein
MAHGAKRRTKMETIIKRESINGRTGIEIIGSADLKGQKVFKGTLVPLGRTAGMACFRVDPGTAWIVVGDDLQIVEGAGSAIVAREDLQGNSCCTVLTVQEGGIYKKYGYKRRDAEYCQILDGHSVEVSAAFLLDAGIIKPAVAPEAAIAPPPFNSAFAVALMKISK